MELRRRSFRTGAGCVPSRSSKRNGTRVSSTPCIFLFFCRFGLSSTHTPPRSRGAFLRPGFCIVASPTPNRGVGGAPRNVRVRARHPWGTPSCAKDARERAYDGAYQALARRLASHDTGRPPLGAPPWRFFPPLIPAPAFAGTSGRRLSPRLAPHSGSSLEHALNEQGCERSSMTSLRSQ